MPTQTFNGTALFYEDQGDGEPVVLVHGSWAEQTTWDLVVPGLARTHRVIRYDRRGHGQSTAAAPEQGTVRDDVADLATLIEDLDLAPANVVGNSFGACISLRLAGERPELVRRLAGHEPPMVGVLFGDPAVQPLLDDLQRRIGSIVELLENGKDADAAELFVEQVALGPGTWRQLPEPVQATFVRNAPTYLGETRDPEGLTIDLDRLSRFTGPVLLSQGDQSPPMFPAVIGKLDSALPKAQHHVFAGAGHVPQMTHPDDFVSTLTSFLAS
jgi:pimeloyl-ACP methyl ester carboxylesterase